MPGVSYPEALSENLTSKRTSHKIAEQGRRNRINNALQEIAALLPGMPQMNAKAEAASNSQSSQSNSKANTVEQAIDYIKSLQIKVRQLEEKLDAVETRLHEKEVLKADGDGKESATAAAAEDGTVAEQTNGIC